MPNSQVALVAEDGTQYAAGTVGVDSISQLTATFDLTSVPAGTYDVRVILPSGTNTTLPAAFEVLAVGQPRLETRVIVPPVLGRHAPATLYVEYANTGTAPMLATVLTLRSGDPDDSDRPLLTLDQTRLTQGFWTDAVPDGFANSAQIYASGATPGLLLPSERVQVPVYYAGLQQPWDFSDTQVEFQIDIHDAGDTSPIDWAALKSSLQPSWMAAEAWDAVYTNLQVQIGATFGDYIRMLNENATYLLRLGESVTDVGQLYGFEVQQAIGLSPLRTLASVTDATVPTPGLPLSFARSFGNTITERYQVGPFGRGWAASWQVNLVQQQDGTVIVQESADRQRRFQPDSRVVGRYFRQTGDTGTLRQVSGGAFELTEANGQITWFREDGTLEYVQDTNGNRITAGFTGGRMTSLTHSSGAILTIGYNTAGLITSVIDSFGRLTTFSYDPTHSHLLSVTGPGGTTTYTYSVGNGAAREDALTSIEDPSGVIRFFEYDDRGRLVATYLAGNNERITIMYDNAGAVTTTDAQGVLLKQFLDHRGIVVRAEDATGAYLRFDYDNDRMLTRVADAFGRSQAYAWTLTGALKSVTDSYGNTTFFTPGGRNNQPTAFTDANQNVTGYTYDQVGNLAATTYPDGSIERATHDSLGNPIQLVNRRGQVIDRTFNADGQLTHENFPDAAPATYTYDSRGRLKTAIDDRGTSTYTYDTADRLTRVDYPNDNWLEYSYDAAGRRTRMEDHTGFVVNYTYDAAGRLKELLAAGHSLIVKYTYDVAGRLSREDNGNGTYSIYSYDAVGHIQHIAHYARDGHVNSFFDYTYDAIGRRVGIVTIDGAWTYTYDLMNQLTRAVFSSANPAIQSQDLNYVYDALGNRIRTVINAVTTNYATNELNQYTAASETTFEYDRDGNLIVETDTTGTRKYEYDARNRLLKVVTPQGIWRYEYDDFGSRIATTRNNERREYLIDPTGLVNIIGEYDVSTEKQVSYAYGLGLKTISTMAGAVTTILTPSAPRLGLRIQTEAIQIATRMIHLEHNCYQLNT